VSRYDPPAGSIPTLGVPSLDGIRRVHLVGIAGAGMRGIAQLLLSRGVEVSGSDLRESMSLDELRARGAVVTVGHRAENVGDDLDAVVISSAIPATNPELRAATERGIAVWKRAQALAALMSRSRTIAVAGTHGKTTTTSMLCVALDRAGLDPTFVIGGDLNESGSGARTGGGEWFVAEADESDGSFLLPAPEVGVVTNVEEDHLDFYRDGDEIRAAFEVFVRRCGTVVACGDDPGVRAVLEAARPDAVTYGLGPENRIRVVVSGPAGPGIRGEIHVEGHTVPVVLRAPGPHNLLNAAAAIAAARLAGVEPERAAQALGSFTGVRRRFEYRGAVRGAELFDDYAHHPTEVAATLAAARNGYRRVIAVFQPHRYSRTRAMGRALGESLASADVVVVTDVYGAGETPMPGVTGKLVVDGLTEFVPGKRVAYLPRRQDLIQYLVGALRPGDLVLTLGAGDVTTVAEEVMDRIRGGG
jgi:UDP-N-acetylmuramate--alanine ligase